MKHYLLLIHITMILTLPGAFADEVKGSCPAGVSTGQFAKAKHLEKLIDHGLDLSKLTFETSLRNEGFVRDKVYIEIFYDGAKIGLFRAYSGFPSRSYMQSHTDIYDKNKQGIGLGKVMYLITALYSQEIMKVPLHSTRKPDPLAMVVWESLSQNGLATRQEFRKSEGLYRMGPLDLGEYKILWDFFQSQNVTSSLDQNGQ